ncbi:MAG: HEPN domain-containing protein [Candidatus Aenigmarchaeota archaeon]|nr:HEPN domain-containing protein [Candidatus Aenigmarchaeota archaeon]
MNSNIPKNEKAIENDFRDCERVKAYIPIDKESFKEYLIRAQKDLGSAFSDLENGYFYWSVIKSYQVLFFATNALLVKYCGYYSKNHKCLLTALLKEKVISAQFAKELDKTINGLKNLNEIDGIRLERNKALYQPISWKTITKQQAERILERVRNLMNEMVGLL